MLEAKIKWVKFNRVELIGGNYIMPEMLWTGYLIEAQEYQVDKNTFSEIIPVA